MTIEFVRYASTQLSATGSTIPVTITAPTVGNGLFAVLAASNPAGGTSISDNGSGAWSAATQSANGTTLQGTTWYRQINVGDTPPTVVTVSHPSMTTRSVIVAEFSGVDFSAFDQFIQASNTNSSLSSGAATPSRHTSLLISVATVATGTTSIFGTFSDGQSGTPTDPGSPGTANNSDGIFSNAGSADVGGILTYEVATGNPVAYTFSSTLTSSVAWTTQLYTFNPIAQHARPASDVSVGTWLTDTGSGTSEFAAINEATINDANYIQSAVIPNADQVEVTLGAVSDPLVSTDHILRYRTRLDALSPAGAGAMSLVTELRQGTAALSTAVSNTTAPASITEATQTVTLSAAQADAIIDYSLLRLRSTATQAQAAAPTFVAAGTFIATASNAQSITPGLPAGTNGQDILLLCIERGDNTAATALTGWTNIAALTANDTTAQRVEVWWRVAAGTAGSATSTTAIAITFGSSTIVRAGQMFAFRGADVTTPFVLSSFKTNASGNTCATTDISPTITNTLGFFAAMAVGQRTAATTPSGWAAPVVSNTALGNDTSIAYTTKTFAANGSYGAPSTTWTSTTSGVTEGVLFAIQPPVNASKARITWAELEVPGRTALGELSGRPFGLLGQMQMHQLLAQ